MITVTTIGFSKKSLEKFLSLLSDAKVTKLVDTRLNNTSQLSGFSKKHDLKFILENFANIKYDHRLDLAPTKEILDDFKNKRIDWSDYEKKYTALLDEREVKNNLDKLILENEVICFLCSEEKPHKCHRSLLANYVKVNNPNVEISHLV